MRALITAKVRASSPVFGGAVAVRTTVGSGGVAAGEDGVAERHETKRKNTRERRRADVEPDTTRMRCDVQNASSSAPGGGGGGARGGGVSGD